MNYSQASISNLALGRIGARGQIVSINENSPNAVKCLAVWDAIFAEVSSERDWKTMKTRQQLALSPVTPLYGYRYAWAMPDDFLRFVRPHKRRPTARTGFAWLYGGIDGSGGWYDSRNPPFWPPHTDYIVETLTAGWQIVPPAPPIPYPAPFPTGKYALTDYDGSCAPVAINYIRLITDYTQLMPGFVNCLAYRLAQELCIGVTEDKNKWKLMEEKYKECLNSAEAQNETMDFEPDEAGSTSWVDAGRNGSYGGYEGGGWF